MPVILFKSDALYKKSLKYLVTNMAFGALAIRCSRVFQKKKWENYMSEEMKSTTDVAEGAATEKKKASLIIKMIIGSVLGLLLFCVPLPWGGGSSTMLLSIMKTAIENQIAGILRPIALAIMVISLVGTIYMFITKDKEHGKFVKAAFAPTIVNVPSLLSVTVITRYCCA